MMKIIKHTDKYIYIMTEEKQQLKITNPRFNNKHDLYEWLEVVAKDFDTKMRDKND